MNEKIKSDLISRRRAFSLLRLVAAFSTRSANGVRSGSPASPPPQPMVPFGQPVAPQTGAERRRERRKHRKERRSSRRTGSEEKVISLLRRTRQGFKVSPKSGLSCAELPLGIVHARRSRYVAI
jgi:hypothetical protein